MEYLVLAVLGLILVMGLGQRAEAGMTNEAISTMDQIRSAVSRWSEYYGLDPLIVYSVIRTESSFNPNAVNPSDPSFGLMGISKILYTDYLGILPSEDDLRNLYNIEENVHVGCWNLNGLLSRYEFDVAIQCYNEGETSYANGYRVPSYLGKVKNYYNDYQINGGP